MELINKLIEDILQGMTFKEFVFKYVKMTIILLMVFYYIYPQALGIFGRSFIVPAGALGLGLYAYHKFPFVEIHKALIYFALLLFYFYICESMNQVEISFIPTYLRSQMGFFFSAYLIIFVLFNAHKKPKFEVIVGYIAAAIILQCIITLSMHQDEAIRDFFYSLQMEGGDFEEETREIIEEQRLMGYGTALFGAGMVAGYALIFIVYLISKIKLTKIQFVALAISYSFVFFIGLFSARTTIMGLVGSIIFLFVLYYIDGSTEKKQPINFITMSGLFFFIGAGMAVALFPDYTEWAFELFDNYQETGKFSTKSSDQLYNLFYFPFTFSEMLWGTEYGMNFWGNDMGYTRLMFFIGIPGMLLFFSFQFFMTQLMMTKDLTANALVITVFAYSLMMNIKGFTDMNPTLYLFLFYFCFYKYYRYYPDLYLQQRIYKQQELLKEEENKKIEE